MGLEVFVPRRPPVSLDRLLERLAAAGHPSTVAMVDGVLLGPGARPPPTWRDARLRTPAGVVTLRRAPEGVAIVVFANAEAGLRAAQQAVAEALQGLP